MCSPGYIALFKQVTVTNVSANTFGKLLPCHIAPVDMDAMCKYVNTGCSNSSQSNTTQSQIRTKMFFRKNLRCLEVYILRLFLTIQGVSYFYAEPNVIFYFILKFRLSLNQLVWGLTNLQKVRVFRELVLFLCYNDHKLRALYPLKYFFFIAFSYHDLICKMIFWNLNLFVFLKWNILHVILSEDPITTILILSLFRI